MTATRIICGFHAVIASLRQNAADIEEIYVDAARRDARTRDVMQLAVEHGARVLTVTAARLRDLTGQGRHQGIAARVSPLPAHTLDEILTRMSEPALFLVLDGVQDPHNLGACLRVADAFSVHAVLAPKDRAVGLTSTVSKTAAGAAETVPFIAVTNLARTLRELKQNGVWIVGADHAATQTLYDIDLALPTAWVLGAEGAGMRRLTREHCDHLVRIPMSGHVESLNVSVASGICLAETCRQRKI